MAKKLDLKDIVELSNKYHNNRYDYSSTIYINRRTAISVYCPAHQTYFQVNPRNHYDHGVRCKLCFNEDKLKQHIDNANNQHKYKYDYSLLPLNTRAKDIVDIICPIHGQFQQNLGNHLYGQGCPTCGSFFWSWSEEKFNQKCLEGELGTGIFYILKCSNGNEVFYKLGITSKSIYSRYRSNGDSINVHMPYTFEVVQEIKSTPSSVWLLESFLKNYIIQTKLHYVPKEYFAGSLTECFCL